MPCSYCRDSHSAFDPCPQAIAAIRRIDAKLTKRKPKKKRRAAAPGDSSKEK